MQRRSIQPRPQWRQKVEELGLIFHSTDEVYWDESACYEFSVQEIDVLESATNELHRICLDAVRHAIETKAFARLHIPERYVPLIINSWERGDRSLYGRFDLCFDGAEPPKLYEYNADTPTSLLEASVIQWYWLEEVYPHADQFNSIHEKLVARWREAALQQTVHFACVRDHAEDVANTVYLEDAALQAGLATKRLFMDEIGWNGWNFVDLEKETIRRLFKLYPWEWLLEEAFSEHLLQETCRVIEPAWKLILSNKAILPLLWEMFPDHPNLLPAFSSAERLGSAFVKKPIFGREGANISLTANGQEVSTAGAYGAEGFVYQALQSPPEFDGKYAVVGSWIVGDEACGIGIRESDGSITQNTSRFVPHFFRTN